MDTITIDQLQVNTIIGVYPYERQVKQPLIITCKFTTNAKRISEQDDLNKAIDYGHMSEFIVEFAHNHQFNLIETFAEKLSESLISKFLMSKIKLTITKPLAVKEAKGISITIERTKNAS